MTKHGVLYDLTAFCHNPMRTGIQRVTLEVAMGWKGPLPLVPFLIGHDAQPRLLPPRAIDRLTEYFGRQTGNSNHAADFFKNALLEHRALPAAAIGDYPAVFNTEVYWMPYGLRFWESLLQEGMKEKLFFFMYDLLPHLHPEWWPQGCVLGMMGYLRLLREVGHVCFDSDAARQDYLQHVLRKHRPTGPVLPPGADGLGVVETPAAPRSRQFALISTVEPRKGHGPTLEAFETLWSEGVEVDLVVVGRAGWAGKQIFETMERLERVQPRFRWLRDVGDDVLGDVIRGSLATIYPSLGEGYGLPPTESLSLGVPAIVGDWIPSAVMLGPLGQVRLPTCDAAAIRQAVLAMLDDTTAARKRTEIRGLRLPRWSELGVKACQWVHDEIAGRSAELAGDFAEPGANGLLGGRRPSEAPSGGARSGGFPGRKLPMLQPRGPAQLAANRGVEESVQRRVA